MRLFGFRRGETAAEAKASYEPAQWAGAAGTAPSVIRTFAGSSIAYLDVYRSQPAVRHVVGFIAENMAQVPIKTYRRISDADREYLGAHGAQRLLSAPNPELSQFEFMRDLVTDLEVFDVAFYRISDDRSAVLRLFPDAVELRDFGPFGPETFRVHKLDGTHTDLRRDQVLYLHGYGDPRGVSAIETLRRVLAEDVAAGEYREGLYKNGMRNAGVIERPLEAPDWSDKARTRFLDQLEDRYTGSSNAGRPLLLEEGMAWKSDQITQRSDEYIASRELTTRVVANTYRISPTILGLTDAPYASISEYNRQLYQNVLAPRLTHVTQSLERQLLAPSERTGGVYFEFSLEAKLRGSFQEQAAIGSMAVGGPWMLVDEYRALMELPPLTDEQRAQLNTPAPASGAPNTGAGATDQPSPSEDSIEPELDVPKSAPVDVEGIVRRTFDRAAAQAKAHPEAFTPDRWTRELTRDLSDALAPIPRGISDAD